MMLTSSEVKRNDEPALNMLQEKLISKCKQAGFKTEIKKFLGDEVFIVAYIPNGREYRQVAFFQDEIVESAIDLAFEKCTFLGDFNAIANYEDDKIEALIRPINLTPTNLLQRKLFGEVEEGEELQPLILYKGDTEGASIEIGEATDVLKLLARVPNRRSKTFSLKLSGFNISQHDKSLGLLRRFADSLFFQLDIQGGPTLSLTRDRRPLRRAYRPKDEVFDLSFPKAEFDEGPMSLYWYARSALGMPLLQFLAFYQVIEYYYPSYSQEEARRRVRAILKDPTFRSDRDADIGKVLSIVSGASRGFGDERSQLRATLNACLDPQDLWNFFEEDEQRKDFFSSKQKGLTNHKLSLATSDTDLRSPVADLVYDIRCKIVHTKSERADGDVELLLPFSKEAELLFHDIELIQYVARKVLIAASTSISL